MAALNEQLLCDVLALSIDARAELVDKILESLNLGPDEKIVAAWEEKIERRIEEVEKGKVKLISENQVFDEIRTRFKK
jgi:putative addiction module component (TIGR02574 family)